MTIQYRFFIIPVKGCEQAEDDLNRFLRSHRVLTVHRDFVARDENSFWAMAVEYLSDGAGVSEKQGRKGRADYKEMLSPEDFAVFVKLREWRKKTADEEGTPVYTIFTNEQLAEMVQRWVSSKASLREISGIVNT